jgi:steroid delta-isomerase-like uncharacterized protein
MSREANIKLVRESIDALNARDIDRLLNTFHEEYSFGYGVSDPWEGHKMMRTGMEALFAAVPDMHREIHQIIADDEDNVVLRYSWTGTHEGEFNGIAPTHKKIEVHGCTVTKVKTGKRYQVWQYYASPTFPEQIVAE